MLPSGQYRCDMDSPERIQRFVQEFYRRMLDDPQLAPFFTEVARVDLDKHLPLISAYWQKLLLGERQYQRHTMNIHRAVAARQAFTPADFERWLGHYHAAVDSLYSGPTAERAKRIANTIATNMQTALAGLA